MNSKIYKTYKLASQIGFSLAGVGIAYFLGLMRNPMIQRVACVGTGNRV